MPRTPRPAPHPAPAPLPPDVNAADELEEEDDDELNDELDDELDDDEDDELDDDDELEEEEPPPRPALPPPPPALPTPPVSAWRARSCAAFAACAARPRPVRSQANRFAAARFWWQTRPTFRRAPYPGARACAAFRRRPAAAVSATRRYDSIFVPKFTSVVLVRPLSPLLIPAEGMRARRMSVKCI